MTPEQVATFIIRRWLDDHTPAAIAMQLLCLGSPIKRAEIFAVIRRYIDCQTENNTYMRKR